MASLTILRAGLLTTVQDLGRAQQRRMGVSLGGALDLHAARIANLLAGNAEEAALLEVTLGGLRLRFDDERAVAWCGGEFGARLAERELPAGRRALVRPGQELRIEAARRGCRAWLAIGGGIDSPVILGSRATDLRAGFGGYEGRALRDGDLLSLGDPPTRALETGRIASWSGPADWTQTAAHAPLLRVVRGSAWAEFSPDSQLAFLRESFAVSAKADRMGARLEGPKLRRTTEVEMLSEAAAPGTVQVANDGQPIVLLGDCQTIGGYPRIAHVITIDLPLAAQLRPNDSVRFREVTLSAASMLFRERENNLERFRVGLRLRAR